MWRRTLAAESACRERTDLLEQPQAELGAVDQQDRGLGLLDHRALDPAGGRVRVRDPGTGDAAGADDRLVGVILLEKIRRLMAEHAVLAVIVDAGTEQDTKPRVARQALGDADAIGENRQVQPLGGECLGEMVGGRAAVDHQDVIGIDQRDRQPGDPGAFGDVLLLALENPGLRGQRDRRGAAVGTVDHALLGELVDIPSDGLRGDAELLRQGGDAHRQVAVQLPENQLLPFLLGQAFLHDRRPMAPLFRHGPS
jgi:hypothetical protein